MAQTDLVRLKLQESGWETPSITARYLFTRERKLGDTRTTKAGFADYLLTHKNIRLALIDTRHSKKHPLGGLQQAISYAKKLHLPFAYCTNGHEIYEHSLQEGKGRFIDNFPSPENLFDRGYGKLNEEMRKHLTQPFYAGERVETRFYQEIATQKAIEALLSQRDRALLSLAAGTGKTYVALQIAHRLLASGWRRIKRAEGPRILLLTDHAPLVDRVYRAFRPLAQYIVDFNRQFHPDSRLFFSVHPSTIEDNPQALEVENLSAERLHVYPPDFFDLILLDIRYHTHRVEKSSWERILDHFHRAAHVGLATSPINKETKAIYHDFGKPIYEYTLWDGISDGFLASYKIKRFPKHHGAQHDMEESAHNLAKMILQHIDPTGETLIFCEHAKDATTLKDTIDSLKGLLHRNDGFRIISQEEQAGRSLTSTLLAFGIDTNKIHNIILASPIHSMTALEEIMACGARICEGKDSFTLIDFTDASCKLCDVTLAEEGSNSKEAEGGLKEETASREIVVKLKNRDLNIINKEISHIDEKGRTLNSVEFLKILVATLEKSYDCKEKLREIWSDPVQRRSLLERLQKQKIGESQLQELEEILKITDSDLYDIFAYLSFDHEVKTRRERGCSVQESGFFGQYHHEKARKFLEVVLVRYEQNGFKELAENRLPTLIKLSGFDTPTLRNAFFPSDMKQEYLKLQKEIYR